MLRVPSEIKSHQFESLKIQENTFVAYRSDIYPHKNDVFFEENAVIYVLEGEKLFSNFEQEVRVKKGDALFIKRGYYLMSESINVKYRSLVFFMSEKLLKEFVATHIELFELEKLPPEIESSILLKFSTKEAFAKFIDSLLPYFKNTSRYLNQFLKLKVQELLLHLLEIDSSESLKMILFSIYSDYKTDLEYLVNSLYLKPLSINELAHISGRSLSGFKREFSEKFGQSPGAWIRERKLEKAAFLLKSKIKNVEETAEAVGYDNISHFIKSFKERFGLTPLQFVKSHTKK